MNAPVCPVSFGEQKLTTDILRKTIQSIPKATDLNSAIIALNAINNVIRQLTVGDPVINNTYNNTGTPTNNYITNTVPSSTLPGTDNNPGYTKANWIEESRNYVKHKLYNYDDESQYIEIKVLNRVTFTNVNTSGALIYYGAM